MAGGISPGLLAARTPSPPGAMTGSSYLVIRGWPKSIQEEAKVKRSIGFAEDFIASGARAPCPRKLRRNRRGFTVGQLPNLQHLQPGPQYKNPGGRSRTDREHRRVLKPGTLEVTPTQQLSTFWILGKDKGD